MFFVIGLIAFLASVLTLFSGFGLGTLLTPVFGLFFPIHVAVALTGIVHLLNNLFKLVLLGKQADRATVLQFGLPSVVGGLVGAWLLASLSQLPILHTWVCCGKVLEISWLKLIIALVMIFFALMEIVPALSNLRFGRRYLTIGGLISGFFGGLSGHQGALRSAFLVQLNLRKEQFIASGVLIACMVDLTRLPVYFSRFEHAELWHQWPLLLVATGSAFAGAYLGARFIKKVTLKTVQTITAVLILVIAVLLGTGIL
jgi:uncharacterized protein